VTTPVVICDLDDTLLRTDLLFESVLKLIRTKPWLILKLPGWFLKGRAHGKAKIAQHVKLDPALLPYRDDVLRLVKSRRQSGAKTVLLSASNQELVTSISKHCQCFDESSGSSDSLNLKGIQKLAWIERHYPGSFEYIGDSSADIPIWRKSSHAVLVNPSSFTASKVKSIGMSCELIDDRTNRLRLIIKQLRVNQWIKNVLIAVPLISAHKAADVDLLVKTFLGMISFSLIASMVYVMNDMLDVENDRKHPTKKERPFASGRLPIKTGFFLAPLLGVASFSVASLLGWKFASVISIYFLVNIVYSVRLKEEIMLDVVTLASFYTMRLMAGAAATEIMISQWLLSFSTFFFLGLAMVKRYTELLRIVSRNHNALHGRGYTGDDKIPVLVMGITCSMLSILILALFFASPDVQVLYREPYRLWMLAPILLFWTGRIWLLTQRGQVDDDPVVFAVKDRVSLAVLVYIGLVISWAT
jgi:4-hydroxybenzoate polyprenyltransferase